MKYREIAETLKKRIKTGRYPIESKIPSEAELSSELEVSRPTIKSAIDLLVNEGVLYCIPSVGSFVKRKPGERIIVGYLAVDFVDPFHAEMISNLEKITGENGYGLTVAASGNTLLDEQKGIERLVENGAVGVLASKSLSLCYEKSIYKLPLVWCGGIPADTLYDRVSIDNEKGMQLLVEHLVSLGVKRIGYAEAENRAAYASERGLELKKILIEKGLPVKEEWFVYSRSKGDAGGPEILTSLLKSHLPEAVMCYNDWTAAGVVEAALEKKIAVPGKLKVTGFDNINLSKYFKVPLTTVNYRIKDIAGKSLELLIQRIRGSKEKPQTVIIELELIIRASTTGRV